MKSIDHYALKSLKFNALSDKPASNYVLHGGELQLSNIGQMELLRAMNERGVLLRTMVCGFSMYPFIKDQDVLTIAPVTTRQPQVGEVVACTHPAGGRLVIHRIIADKETQWLLKGDNNSKVDGLVINEDILGRVVRVERQNREMCLGLRTTGIASRLIAFLSLHNLLVPILKLASLPLRLVQPLKSFLRSFLHKTSQP